MYGYLNGYLYLPNSSSRQFVRMYAIIVHMCVYIIHSAVTIKYIQPHQISQEHLTDVI